MKNDIIIAVVGLVMSALIAWVAQLTVMVFEIDKDLAVHKVEAVREEKGE